MACSWRARGSLVVLAIVTFALLYIQSDLQKGSEYHFMANSKLQAFWNHPAGPKTIHFWAPTFKWGLTIANILDSATPPEKLSYPQQSVLACSGLIWARYSTVIIPKNWNLVSVNFAMSVTAMYQLSRKIQHDLSIKNKEVAAEEE